MKWDAAWVAGIAAAASALFAVISIVFQIRSANAADRSAAAEQRSAAAAEQANQYERERRNEEIEAAERRSLEAQFEVTVLEVADSAPAGQRNYILMFARTGPSPADHVEYRVSSRRAGGRGPDATWVADLGPFNLGDGGQTRSVPLPSDLTQFKVELRWNDNARLDLRGSATFKFDGHGQPVAVALPAAESVRQDLQAAEGSRK